MELSGTTIALTGATGFLGGYLVASLRQRGARVVAVVRNPEKARGLAEQGCRVARADLADPEALELAFRGAEVVISNAAVISFLHPAETRRTNIEGTRNVFDAAARAGVRRAVAISSTSAYPASPFRQDERVPLRRRAGAFWSAYADSKALAERLAWEICDARGIALTTFRPCGITGKGDPLLMPWLRRFMRLPVAPFPLGTVVGVVHAEDAAEAVACALERPEVSVGRAYNLQGQTTSLWHLGSLYRSLGGKAPWLRVPVPVPYLLRFDDARARRDLGFAPRGVDDIVREALALEGAS